MSDIGEIRTPQFIKLQTILEDIDDGKYSIPSFQREYVWNKSHILDLLDSIFHNYPCGSLLMLENNIGLGVEIRPFENCSNSITEESTLVLDGQQRLTSCYHVFHNKSKSYTYFIDLRELYKQWKNAPDHKRDRIMTRWKR